MSKLFYFLQLNYCDLNCSVFYFKLLKYLTMFCCWIIKYQFYIIKKHEGKQRAEILLLIIMYVSVIFKHLKMCWLGITDDCFNCSPHGYNWNKCTWIYELTVENKNYLYVLNYLWVLWQSVDVSSATSRWQ